MVRVQQRLRTVPNQPGVYLLKDSSEKVLYIGKSSSLQNRLRTYFGPTDGLSPKIRKLVTKVTDFELILTDSEAEALILECTLIKQFRPYYNARLKDDKTYPYLKIDLSEEFPQIYITRRILPDGARYFGPFATTGSVRKTMDLLKKLFPYRSCTKVITGTDAKPCLEYHINRCVAPCIGAATKDDYHRVIQQVVMFMEGKTDAVVRGLRQKMSTAASDLQFERAALLRDQLRAVQRVSEEQRIKVASTTGGDSDCIAMAIAKNETWVEVFFIRSGRLVGREHFMMEGTQDDAPGRILSEFVKQFYRSAPSIPKRIILQYPLEDFELIRQWLQEKRGSSLKLVCPKRGEQHKLVKMVENNAAQGLSQLRIKWISDSDAIQQALVNLQEELAIPNRLHKIECYDISNIQGSDPVGSMVTFIDGDPKTSAYRRFKIKGVSGIDDYSMMKEVLRRRLVKLVQAKHTGGSDLPVGELDTWQAAPDLVLIDGGKGHLSAALEVFLELGIDSVFLASIAKENEWLYVPHTPEPIILPHDSHTLHLVQRIRDEAHRFAITYHRNLRSKRSILSSVDMVTGIGPARKKILLRTFGTLKGIKDASIEDLSAVPGMTKSLAIRLKGIL